MNPKALEKDRDWERWEREFDEDVRVGKLESLADDALDAKAKGIEGRRTTNAHSVKRRLLGKMLPS